MTGTAMHFEQTDSGIAVPTAVVPANVIPASFKYRARVKTVTLASGERARVTLEDGRRVTHVLRSLPGHADEVQDAIVCPGPIGLALRRD